MAFPEESLPDLVALGEVALAGHDDLTATLNEVCGVAVRCVPAADGASLTSFTEQGPRAVASSDAWSRSLDELQHAEREGPCYDASRTGLVFRVRDMDDEARWPSYTPRAAAKGLRSMVAWPLTLETKTTGALNMYSRSNDAFDAEAVSVSEIIAAHVNLASRLASTLFGHKELSEQLRAALVSRAVIEQAKGIIMATTGCGVDDAFAVLRQQSQHENRKIRDIAQALVARYERTEATA